MLGLSRVTATALALLCLSRRSGAADGDIKPAEPGNTTEIHAPRAGLLSHNPFDTLWTSGGSYAGPQIMRHSSSPPWRAGTPSVSMREGDKPRMGVVFICDNKWWYNSIYWKGGFSNSFRQDRSRNQINLQTSVGQLGENNQGAVLLHEKPVEILTAKKSSACSAETTWKASGGIFAPLAAALRNLVNMLAGNGENLAIGASSPSNGIGGSLPCDPISPLWLEKSNTVVKFAGEERYTAGYKLRGRFNRGDGNGGLKPDEWLIASCSKDHLYYSTNRNDPTWVVFW